MGNIVDLAALAAKHGIQEIVLPGWDVSEPFECKAKRPSIFNMASTGHIPNPLMGAVQKMFSNSEKDADSVPLDQQAKVMIQIARYALVEPSYDEIEAAGLTLTDEQLMTIYAYAIGGAAVLEPFRKRLRGGVGEHGDAVQSAAEQPAGD